jgi:hypothetical protein
MLRLNNAYVGEHNIFVRGNTSPEFLWNEGYIANLAAWQAATGQDANSVYMNTAQYATFWTGSTLAGDFRFNGSNAVTASNGSVFTGTFPDGVPLSTAGPQEHFNWNTRTVDSGPPTKWPVPPQTIAEAQTYVANPTAWNFY